MNLLPEHVVGLLRAIGEGKMRGAFRMITTIAAVVTIAGGTIAGTIALGSTSAGHASVQAAAVAASPLTSMPSSASAQPARPLDLYVEAYVTGYNTVRAQTDGDPCIAASGANICGRRDTVACPPLFDLGTVVEINGRKYTCEDRTAPRFRSRFDINCDKDKTCPYAVAGWTTVRIYLE